MYLEKDALVDRGLALHVQVRRLLLSRRLLSDGHIYMKDKQQDCSVISFKSSISFSLRYLSQRAYASSKRATSRPSSPGGQRSNFARMRETSSVEAIEYRYTGMVYSVKMDLPYVVPRTDKQTE